MLSFDDAVAEVRVERNRQVARFGEIEQRSFEEFLILFQQFASEVQFEYAHNGGNSVAKVKLIEAVNLGMAALQVA